MVHGVYTGTSKILMCESFFTFVALGPPAIDGSRAKVQLRKAVPGSPHARANFHLAAERRKLRFKAAETVRAAISRSVATASVDPIGLDRVRETKSLGDLAELDFETMEIVFPQHTQHHGTTFGGVIMSWAVTCAVSCGEQYVAPSPAFATIEEDF